MMETIKTLIDPIAILGREKMQHSSRSNRSETGRRRLKALLRLTGADFFYDDGDENKGLIGLFKNGVRLKIKVESDRGDWYAHLPKDWVA